MFFSRDNFFSLATNTFFVATKMILVATPANERLCVLVKSPRVVLDTDLDASEPSSIPVPTRFVSTELNVHT